MTEAFCSYQRSPPVVVSVLGIGPSPDQTFQLVQVAVEGGAVDPQGELRLLLPDVERDVRLQLLDPPAILALHPARNRATASEGIKKNSRRGERPPRGIQLRRGQFDPTEKPPEPRLFPGLGLATRCNWVGAAQRLHRSPESCQPAQAPRERSKGFFLGVSTHLSGDFFGGNQSLFQPIAM